MQCLSVLAMCHMRLRFHIFQMRKSFVIPYFGTVHLIRLFYRGPHQNYMQTSLHDLASGLPQHHSRSDDRINDRFAQLWRRWIPGFKNLCSKQIAKLLRLVNQVKASSKCNDRVTKQLGHENTRPSLGTHLFNSKSEMCEALRVG